MNNQLSLLDRLVPTAASAKLWRAVTGTFLALGLLAAANTVWIVGTDLHARQSWPRTGGEITSISEESSAGVARASRRTRYWVQYVVRFIVPPGQCQTGVTDGSEGDLTKCVGTVRTRSTQSTFTAGTWMRESFRQTSVQVLYNPHGPEIKIEGESPWLRYQWDSIAVIAVWLVACGVGFSLARRRLRTFEAQLRQPGAEKQPR